MDNAATHGPDELTAEFLAESRDNLRELETALLGLDRAPADRALLDRAFRAVHTIKGTCGFLGFPVLGASTHAAEDLLGALRDSHTAVPKSALALLFAMQDWVARSLDAIASTGVETAEADTALLSRLRQAASAASCYTPAPQDACTAVPEPAGNKPTSLHANAEAAPAQPHSDGVRVKPEVLDAVIDAAGRLLLVRNQLVQRMGIVPEELRPLMEEADRIARDLRHCSVRLRLQPVESILSRCPRVVRDIAALTGKLIHVTLQGQDIELDRAVLDAVRDPLLHCVRNAADHGIEAPEARTAAGKPPEGSITIRAARQGSWVLIEITDDGAGIDSGKLLARALRTGVLTPAQAEHISVKDTLDLVFHPGMTTARQVTSFSGRGVGMDVVKTGVEAIGGRVELQNTPGHGLTVRMLLPLTLAIFAAAIIRSGSVCFGLPFAAIDRVLGARDFRVDRQAGLVFLEEDTLPLADLRQLAGQPPRSRVAQDSASVLVLSEGSGRFALMVDQVLETEQVVIKPLQPCLRENGLYNDAATLGSGVPARFLDLRGIAALLPAHAQQTSAFTGGELLPGWSG